MDTQVRPQDVQRPGTGTQATDCHRNFSSTCNVSWGSAGHGIRIIEAPKALAALLRYVPAGTLRLGANRHLDICCKRPMVGGPQGTHERRQRMV
mmetsp:Transcript_58454/g.161752  ORF Transcript_58454/g.161752 Transcript_58454/m.161752 type:complete len:94 (-) Transcript_58454:1851-2132(-)